MSNFSNIFACKKRRFGISFGFFLRFIYLLEIEGWARGAQVGMGRERILSKVRAQCAAQRGVQSHDPEIMT